MGVDYSTLGPPADKASPFLGWDEYTIKQFLGFVKGDEEGSFRLTKWKMLEFTGMSRLQDVNNLFALFEEPGESSVSGLQLAAALLLCNQNVPIRFKASECLSLLDWTGEGHLTIDDLRLMLQLCVKSLSRCVGEMPSQVDQGSLDKLVQDKIPKRGANLDALLRWSHSEQDIYNLLAQLSPHDTEGKPIFDDPADVEPQSLEEEDAPVGDEGEGDEDAEGPGDEEDVDAGDAKELGDEDLEEEAEVRASPSDDGNNENENAPSERNESPAHASEAAGPSSATPAGDDEPQGSKAASRAVSPGEPQQEEEEGVEEIEPPEEEQEEEDPFAGCLPELRRQKTLEAYLKEARESFSKDIAKADALQLSHGDQAGSGLNFGGQSDSNILEREWEQAFGYLLPLLQTSWTVPSEKRCSQEAIRAALNSWVWLHKACILEEATADATTVASVLHATPPSEIVGQAQTAAAARLQEILQSADDPPLIKGNLEAEYVAAERKELWALKALYELRNIYEFPAERLKRDAARLEGVIVFLEFLESRAESATHAPPEVITVLGNASGMLADVQSELQKLETLKPRFEEALVVLQSASLLKEALGGLPKNPQQAVNAVRRKQAGLLAPVKSAASSAAQASPADAEARWRRCEGGLIAAKALAHGSILRCELWLHQAQQISSGFHLQEVKTYLSLSDANVSATEAAAEATEAAAEATKAAADRTKPAVSLYRRRQVLESLLKWLGEPDLSPDGAPPETGEPPSLPAGDLASVLTTFKTKELEMYGSPEAAAPSNAAGAEVGAQEAPVDPAAGDSVADDADPAAIVPATDEATADRSAEAEAVSELTLGQYREDRFEWRARDAAGAVVRALLSDGLHSAVVRASAVAAEDQESPGTDGGEFGHRRRLQKSKDALELVLTELRGKCNTSVSAIAWARRELVASYATSAVPSGPSPLSAPPIGVQPAHALGGDDTRRWPGADSFASPMATRNAQIALAVGACRALELIKESAAAPHASTEELRSLKRCVDLKVESYFLSVLAEQALSEVELTMIRAATSKSGPRGSVSQISEGELGPIEDVLGQAMQFFESCRDIDMPGFWKRCEKDAELHAKAGTITRLLSAMPGTEGGGEEEGPGPAVEVPPISSWWRGEGNSKPLAWTLAAGKTVDQFSLALSKSIWEKVIRLETTTPSPTPETLQAHAAAIRVWVLAQNRLLAVSAMLHEESASAEFVVQPRRLLKSFSEVMWGRLLRRHAVGCLAGMQQTCAQRSLQYLSTLDCGDEEFLCAEDISRDVAEIRGDLEKATSESLRAVFHDALAAHGVAGQTRVEEGVQQCREALREAKAITGDIDAQAQEYLTQDPGTSSVGSDVQHYAAECRGTLCALEGLKTFVTSRLP